MHQSIGKYIKDITIFAGLPYLLDFTFYKLEKQQIVGGAFLLLDPWKGSKAPTKQLTNYKVR